MTEWKAINLDQVKAFTEQCADDKAKVEGRWDGYSPEVVSIIDEYVSQGNYPYNREIEKLVNEKLFPEVIDSLDGAHQSRHFSLIVYNSQCFRRERDEAQAKAKMMSELAERGFHPATTETLTEAAQSNKWYNVLLNVTVSTMLGQDQRPKEMKLKAAQRGDKIYWVKRAGSRRGWLAAEGQMIRTA